MVLWPIVIVLLSRVCLIVWRQNLRYEPTLKLHLCQRDGMTADSASLQPKTASAPTKLWSFFFLFFFNWSQTKKIFVFCRPPLLWAYHFLSSHSTVQDKMHKILFLIFFFFLNVAVSNPESVFHPELPVIPKPGEFKRLFIWKKTAYETQQKANNNSHFNLTACVLLLSRVSYF